MFLYNVCAVGLLEVFGGDESVVESEMGNMK